MKTANSTLAKRVVTYAVNNAANSYVANKVIDSGVAKKVLHSAEGKTITGNLKREGAKIPTCRALDN